MRSTMQDWQLTVRSLFQYGVELYPNSRIAAFDGKLVRQTTYSETAARVSRLAAALRRLGIRPGDRVGSFCWNTVEHLETYFAVPSMGAVLHTVNLRLSAEQLAYVVNHAEDRILIVDSSVVPVLAKAAAHFRTVERYIIIGETFEERAQDGRGVERPPEGLRIDSSSTVARIRPLCGSAKLPGECLDYEQLLDAEKPHFDWPELQERDAAAMCYTSGTTGNPKGVVYSHRSIYLHSMGLTSANSMGLGENDRILVVPSMFHANSWGLPHAAWLAGSDYVFPNRFLQAEPLCRLISEERPTVAMGVPTIWMDVLRYADSHKVDLSSLRCVVCAGSAVPRSLIEGFEQRHHLRVIQAWGMTETSPIAAIAHPPKNCASSDEMNFRAKTGRALAAVELRIVDDSGNVVPPDGQSIGEIQARGAWITGSYFGEEAADKFSDGWLRTGDMACIDAHGYFHIKDRTKDIIKSGGEWVSSVDLENAIMAHPDVLEAAVIGVPDPRWDERPLGCVVLKSGSTVDADALCAFLACRVVKWWIPERWAFVPEIPKTSVGKFDKKRLRAQQADGLITIVVTGK